MKNGIVSMVIACFFFAIMGACVKFSLKEAHLFETVFFRTFVSGVLIGIFIKIKKISFVGNNPLLLVGRALAGFIALNLIFYATSKIPLGDAAILAQTSPLFVVLFSVIFLKEEISKLGILLSIGSLLGVAFIVKPSFLSHNLPALAGLGGGMMAALAYISIRQLHATDSSWTMTFYFTAVGSLISFPLAFPHLKFHRPVVMLSLIGTGIAGTFGQLLMTYAYKLEEASVVSPITYLNVVFAFLFGMFFFGEIPDLYSILGSLIVIGCCIGISEIRNMKYEKTVMAIHESPLQE